MRKSIMQVQNLPILGIEGRNMCTKNHANSVVFKKLEFIVLLC